MRKEEAKKTSNFKILIIEDSSINCYIIQKGLEKAGYYADIALNGKEALKILKNNHYDLIFMDCQMPEMNGYETTREIRNNPSCNSIKNIPIIAMTANALKGDREKCLNSGMNDYITKPISLKTISQLLEKWILKINNKEVEKIEIKGNNIFDKRTLLEYLGNEETAKQLLNSFFSDTLNKINNLKEALIKSDFPKVIKYAHMIKGSSAFVCACNLSNIGEEIEKKAKEKGEKEIQNLVFQFDTEFEIFKKEVEKEFS